MSHRKARKPQGTRQVNVDDAARIDVRKRRKDALHRNSRVVDKREQTRLSTP
jgi:hypothetical protein